MSWTAKHSIANGWVVEAKDGAILCDVRESHESEAIANIIARTPQLAQENEQLRKNFINTLNLLYNTCSDLEAFNHLLLSEEAVARLATAKKWMAQFVAKTKEENK